MEKKLGDTDIASNTLRYATLIGAAIVALGFVPIPLTNSSLPKATLFEWVVALLPLLPLLVLTLSAAGPASLPAVLATFLAMVVLCAGVIGTLILAAFSGGGTEMVILHGTALSLACATSILLISDLRQKARWFVFGIFMLPVLLGVWSLANISVAYSSARAISSESAFCIGKHSRKRNEISSKMGLRGLSFYTTRSGYKIGDTWYFHGLLLVENDGETRVFNWSPRRMSFEEVERPRLLIASPFGSCDPRRGFLQELNLF